MSTARWYSIGRLLAVVYAAGWFAGTWIFTLVSFAIISPQPPDAADRVAHYAYERAVYPQLYLAVVCIVLAMLCFIGLGLVLRHFFPHDGPRQQLMAAAFATAGMFGSLWLFLTLGLLQAVVYVSQGASSQTLQTLTDASALIESPANWLQRAFLLGPSGARASFISARLGPARLCSRGPLLAGLPQSARTRRRTPCPRRGWRTAHSSEWRDCGSNLGAVAGGAPPASYLTARRRLRR